MAAYSPSVVKNIVLSYLPQVYAETLFELAAPPRVAESPVNMECRLVKVVELLTGHPDDPNLVVFGQVVGSTSPTRSSSTAG